MWFTDAFEGPLAATPLEQACRAVLKRGGVLAFSPKVAGLATGGVTGKGKGAGFLADAVMNVGPLVEGERKTPPGFFSIEMGSKAILVVRQRTISVVGEGQVTLHLAPSTTRPARKIVLEGKKVEDLTALRRAARARAEAVFPPARPEAPIVDKGTLIIVGGGGMPEGLMKKFVDLAGGPKASIVVFPTAVPDPIPAKAPPNIQTFKRFGAGKVTVLTARTQEQVESKEFLDALREATGIWFGGGRQWRFVDAYEGTRAHALMHDVLKRGGVIAGSSAGATIQGDYLCRGGVFDNFDMMYEGYERGLGFLKGVGIDQHFAERKRFADMTAFVKTHPQMLGIGIDETTAIIVKGSVADVVGAGKVHFYDARRKVAEGQPDHESLGAGEKYELKERKRLP